MTSTRNENTLANRLKTQQRQQLDELRAAQAQQQAALRQAAGDLRRLQAAKVKAAQSVAAVVVAFDDASPVAELLELTEAEVKAFVKAASAASAVSKDEPATDDVRGSEGGLAETG